MARIYDNITETIGNTPLVRLNRTARKHGVVADVEVEVERRVLDPVRQIEAERDVDEPPPERGELVDPLEDQLPRGVHTGAAGRPRWVVDRQRRDVPEHGRRLHVEEAGVDARKLLDGRSVGAVKDSSDRRT